MKNIRCILVWGWGESLFAAQSGNCNCALIGMGAGMGKRWGWVVQPIVAY